MYLNCTTEESAKRQRQFELLLLEKMKIKQYSQITVRQLCEEVGISRNAFYRYFDGKDDVLAALIDHTLLDYYKTQIDHPSSIDTYREQIKPFLSYWQSQKPLLDALQKNGLDGSLLERCMNHKMQRYFDKAHYPLLGTGDGRYQVLMFAVNGVFSLILNWHHSGYRQSIDEMSEILERIMLKPIVSFSK